MPSGIFLVIITGKNISEDTQEMPQSRSTTFPRHQKKERWGINKDKTNTAFEITEFWCTSELQMYIRSIYKKKKKENTKQSI